MGDHLSAGSGFVRSRQNPGLDEVRKIMAIPKDAEKPIDARKKGNQIQSAH